MTQDDPTPAICAELRHTVRPGWTITTQDHEIHISGTSKNAQDLRAEVWRIARFIAYSKHISIEQLRPDGTAYQIRSSSHSGLSFTVQIEATLGGGGIGDGVGNGGGGA